MRRGARCRGPRRRGVRFPAPGARRPHRRPRRRTARPPSWAAWTASSKPSTPDAAASSTSTRPALSSYPSCSAGPPRSSAATTWATAVAPSPRNASPTRCQLKTQGPLAATLEPLPPGGRDRDARRSLRRLRSGRDQGDHPGAVRRSRAAARVAPLPPAHVRALDLHSIFAASIGQRPGPATYRGRRSGGQVRRLTDLYGRFDSTRAIQAARIATKGLPAPVEPIPKRIAVVDKTGG